MKANRPFRGIAVALFLSALAWSVAYTLYLLASSGGR